MSNLLGEATVLIRPDTTGFRVELEREIKKQTAAPIVIPVTAAVTGTTSGGTTAASKKAETAKQAEVAATRALEKSELALVVAEEKALLATTQLGAARARLTGAISAVTAAEAGLAAAVRSKNDELIKEAQITLAAAEAEEIRARGVAQTVILANAQSAALAKVAAEEAAAAKAARTHTFALEEQAGVERAVITARAQNLRGTAELAQIQALAAKSTNDLATAQLRTITAATEQGAAQITAAAAVRTAAIAQEQLALAIKTGNTQLIEAAALTNLLAVAYERETIAALTATRAESAHAASLANVQKAGLASAAAMTGLRGQVLTAGTGFLLATVGFQAFSKSIKEASDATEEFNKSQVVFGDNADQITDFADTTASSLGVASTEALRAAGIFGNFFRSVNLGTSVAAEMSEQLVRLAADLASFNNADPSQVLENLRSGLAGEAEPLRKFGVFLSEARVQQVALAESGKASAEQLTQQEKIQARYNIILQDSAIASGDFERTQGSLANQTKILKAEVQDLSGQLGQVLIPFLTRAVSGAAEYARVIKIAANATEDFADRLPLIGRESGEAESKVESFGKKVGGLYFRFAVLGPVMGAATLAVKRFGDESEKTALKIPAVNAALSELAQLIGALETAGARGLKNVSQGLNALEVDRLQIQTGQSPGGQAAEEENLRKQIEADKEAIARAASGTAAKRKALEDLRADQQDLADLQTRTAKDVTTGARDAERAAVEAQRAQDAADKAVLDLLTQRRGDAERKAGIAAQTEGLADDIRGQDRIQALIKIQIAKVRAQVTDQQTRAAAIRELRLALQASQREEAALRAQQKADAAASRAEGINLDIAFAETTGNVAREVAARLRLIALLKKQQAAVKKGTNEWKRLRNEIAEQQQAIKDTRTQAEKSDKDGKSAQQFFFEQLQAQQGFAANLMGNLIPSSATGGLVGVPSDNLAGGPGGGIKVAANVQEGKAGGGPTSGQATTTNALLERILSQLQRLNGATSTPEATHQRKVGAAAMDGSGNIHGI